MGAAIRQVVIRGRVQGVGYRAWLEREANARKLEGWVRNRRDGSVEALFAGPAEAVSEMVAQCKCGPPFATVDAVEDKAVDPEDLNLRLRAERFSVLPTL
jgi:acylphosphatase